MTGVRWPKNFSALEKNVVRQVNGLRQFVRAQRDENEWTVSETDAEGIVQSRYKRQGNQGLRFTKEKLEYAQPAFQWTPRSASIETVRVPGGSQLFIFDADGLSETGER